ncbi:ferric iron reductase protein FhuF [Paenibacillus sp. BK033]|uniref:IucA/IucC family C-terminal-domain containing protein n=1 Tax=Paenibacillus sp. BK033 TaxID=2512133 RepID=UPI00104FC091|nr:IucA/IucC family C-terminal-domain containing protein [Paenibacillus sp. BK033]TCN01075.1 ferric iron reductase protein FhuF [Paenibacillus sp. BK033]
MDPFLVSDAWAELSCDYSLTVGEAPKHNIKQLALSELLNAEPRRAYMDWLMNHIGAPNKSVAASMLVKRIASLLVAPVLGAMTYYNKGIGITLEHSRLFHKEASISGTPFPFMALTEVMVTAPDPLNRAAWRAEVIQQLFGESLTPIIKLAAAEGPVSMAILWENVMARIAPIYGDDQDHDDELSRRLREDFLYIAKEAPGERFGMRKNPFASFAEIRDGCWLTGRSKRLTCCLYYQMAPEYCLKCPKP